MKSLMSTLIIKRFSGRVFSSGLRFICCLEPMSGNFTSIEIMFSSTQRLSLALQLTVVGEVLKRPLSVVPRYSSLLHNFSPVCDVMCICTLTIEENALLHNLHLYE